MKMVTKRPPITLDQDNRLLYIQDPSENPDDRGNWVMFLRDRDPEPFPVTQFRSDEPAAEIARQTRSHLYNFVSSNWLDMNWDTEVKPKIIKIVEDFRSQKASRHEAS